MKTFYLFDLDRTILDTEKASAYLIGLVAQQSPELATHLRTQVDVYNQNGTPFAIRDVIAEEVGEEVAAKLEAEFISGAHGQSLLLDGVDDLFAFALQAPERDFGILTYGSVKGQTMKLVATGLDAQKVMITQQKHKGILMTEWKTDHGYQLPAEFGGELVDELVFVDDRIFSFEGLPADVRGYWVANDLSLLDSVEHASNVRPVQTLREVIEHELQIIAN